jgi:riboflavin kinase / FMN adenylyltransferase
MGRGRSQVCGFSREFVVLESTMRVISGLQELGGNSAPSVVTIGNFDGVHLAHQSLLARVVEVARSQGQSATAITFEPHPIKILSPDHAPKLLTPLRRKIELIEKTGIDLLVVLPFTRELARQSPLEFVRHVLVNPLRASSVHVGPNFRFGYRQSGDTEILEELGHQEGFRVAVVPMLQVRGDRVSSTRIRELLTDGKVHKAARLLGRPFSARGPIVAGLGVGRKHTVPTLNLAPIEEQLPKTGVYVTHALLGGHRYDSVTNVGYKPTFGDHRLTVETFLLGFTGQIDEIEMEIEFLYRLRDEMKFQNPAILKVQIQEDARRSMKFFRLLKAIPDRYPQSGDRVGR